MGRGGGGGGKGGGGRAGRIKGAGGAAPQNVPVAAVAGSNVIEVRTDLYNRSIEITPDIAAAEAATMANNGLQELSAYADLPAVANANRMVDAQGNVHVGDIGAPKVTRKLTNEQAMARFEQLGLPRGKAYNNLAASGDASALIELLPAGAKYLGAGVEGVGFSLPGAGHKALRIQHGGGVPLNQIDVGPVGVYADWMGKYGKTFVEQKEAMAMQAWAYGKGKIVNKYKPGAHTQVTLQDKMVDNMAKAGKKVHGVDDHTGNWGIDYKGRSRVFDAGAYRPIGDNIAVAVWEGGNPVKQLYSYKNLAR